MEGAMKSPMRLNNPFLPLNHNDGREVEPARFQMVQDQLAQAFGGLTCYPASKGIWINDRKVYTDRVIPLVVVGKATPDVEKGLIQLAIKCKLLLDQEEIFIVASEVELVNVESK
jgi:hypothetical protein